MLERIKRLVTDPPPAHVFEFSPAGIAWAISENTSEGPRTSTGFEPLPPGALKVSPVEDNIIDTLAVDAAVKRIAPASPNKKQRRPAALILPDYCGRLTVLDFDSFPTKADEQASLVRFRMKKTLPFEVESAALSFEAQMDPKGSAHVVVGAVSLEILSRYEQVLRSSGFQPGYVTLSGLASLALVPEAAGITVFARLNDRVLTVSVVVGNELRLARCLELESASPDEIDQVLQPTLAFVEDEFNLPVEQLIYCGLDGGTRLPVPPQSAGLMGYLAGVTA